MVSTPIILPKMRDGKPIKIAWQSVTLITQLEFLMLCKTVGKRELLVELWGAFGKKLSCAAKEFAVGLAGKFLYNQVAHLACEVGCMYSHEEAWVDPQPYTNRNYDANGNYIGPEASVAP